MPAPKKSGLRKPGMSDGSALAALRSQALEISGIASKKRIDLESFHGASLIDLLDAVAAASGGLMFGFNRSGGMNLILYLEGDKEAYIVFDETAFAAVALLLTEYLWTYAAEKFIDIKKEVEEASTAP